MEKLIILHRRIDMNESAAVAIKNTDIKYLERYDIKRDNYSYSGKPSNNKLYGKTIIYTTYGVNFIVDETIEEIVSIYNSCDEKNVESIESKL